MALVFADSGWGNNKGNECRLIELIDWQYRWGDSPVNEKGLFLWSIDGDNGEEWKNVVMPAECPGRDNNRFLWKRVKLPDILCNNPVLAFRSVDQIFEAYLDGKLIYSFGDLNSDPINPFIGYGSHKIFLPDDFANKFLTLRIYSEFLKIGIYGSAYIGSEGDHLRSMLLEEIDQIFLAFLFILVSFFAFIFFFLEKKKTTEIIYRFRTVSISLRRLYICPNETENLFYPKFYVLDVCRPAFFVFASVLRPVIL